MENIIVAFITGLTTGGLSCLAVQGGLLASSMANQIEKDFQPLTGSLKRGHASHRQQSSPNRSELALPIIVFLLAKLAAYTLLGFMLGSVGQMFQLSVYGRASLQVVIGVFMIGTALRMLNVHPIFRYFAFEPPAFIRRWLRKKSVDSKGSNLVGPGLLGFLTVLIPCGVTQAMMAVALSTGNAMQGAVLMLAFTLGTSPVFFAVAYFATRLGTKLEKHFVRLVAVIVLILAIVTIDSGITLAGSPVSLSRWISNTYPQQQAETAVVPDNAELQVTAPSAEILQSDDDIAAAPNAAETVIAPTPDNSQIATNSVEENIVTVNVKNLGYSPNIVHAKAGLPIQLKLVSQDVRSCALAFVIPSFAIQRLLEPTGTAIIELPAQEQGTQIPFSCSMGMYTGIIIVDL